MDLNCIWNSLSFILKAQLACVEIVYSKVMEIEYAIQKHKS